MSIYILCHGSWYQPSTWERVADRLHDAGRRSVTVTYPGDEGDGTPAPEIAQQSYVDAALAAIDGAPGR